MLLAWALVTRGPCGLFGFVKVFEVVFELPEAGLAGRLLFISVIGFVQLLSVPLMQGTFFLFNFQN
jgi:hypothetical protein